ncbi:MAG TPA: AAA family ATPase [bacterium]|nr:AAA family ATPase [bacterium]
MSERDNILTYTNGYDHLRDELRRLDLLLNLQIQRVRKPASSSEFDAFRGLVIPDEEVDAILDTLSGPVEQPPADQGQSAREMHGALQTLEAQITHKTAAALEQGVYLPLLELERRFGLHPWDIDLLVLCLAPELDLRYEKLYAYLQDNVTSKRPTVDLALRLRWDTLRERLLARGVFSHHQPVFKYQLVSFTTDEQEFPASFLSRGLKIDEHLVKYLLGIEELDEELAPHTEFIRPSLSPENLPFDSAKKSTLKNLIAASIRKLADHDSTRRQVFNLYGPVGVGKKSVAEALCNTADLHLLVIDTPVLLLNPKSVERAVHRLIRQAMLSRAALYFNSADVLFEKPRTPEQGKHLLLNVTEDFPGMIFLGNKGPWNTTSPEEAESIINVPFDVPSPQIRRKIWQNAAPQSVAQSELTELAARFKLTPGKIHQAAATASHLVHMRGGNPEGVTLRDLYQACRIQSSTNLDQLAQKITPLFTWEDIILPRDSMEHLREICLHVKHHQQVFSNWAFERKISLGKGISVLFAGPPGTGKTMGAEVIANELGLDFYKIDLSTVVSKYIGETEKNLSRIFREAEDSNAILFFDEADALFGKRSEVKDSHDRYANIEINYLLQQMEEYEGIVILATNFQKNIDEAFTRRLRFIVDFPFPNEQYRADIWRNIFPEETPRHRDIDYTFLARKFEISGGHIKNIALSAAFLAAENSGTVGMEHIIRAARREFQKMGRMVVKSDFDEYFNLLKNTNDGN